MAKLAYKLVFPLALISFVLITKWWFAVPVDAPGTYFIGFPFPYACDGWHTSLSIQFFLMELVVDFLVYYFAWFIFVFLINKFIKPIKINKAVFLTLLSLNILILTPTIYFFTNSNNIIYLRRPFEIAIFETGFKFIWQNDKEINYEFYQFKQKN